MLYADKYVNVMHYQEIDPAYTNSGFLFYANKTNYGGKTSVRLSIFSFWNLICTGIINWIDTVWSEVGLSIAIRMWPFSSYKVKIYRSLSLYFCFIPYKVYKQMNTHFWVPDNFFCSQTQSWPNGNTIRKIVLHWFKNQEVRFLCQMIYN